MMQVVRTLFGSYVLGLLIASSLLAFDEPSEAVISKLASEWKGLSSTHPKYLAFQWKGTQAGKVVQDMTVKISQGPKQYALVTLEHANGVTEILGMNPRYAFRIEKQNEITWKLKATESRPGNSIVLRIEDHLQFERYLTPDRVGPFKLLDFLDKNQCEISSVLQNEDGSYSLALNMLPNPSGEIVERVRNIQLELSPSRPFLPRKGTILHQFKNGQKYYVDLEFTCPTDENPPTFRSTYRSHAHELGLDDLIEVELVERGEKSSEEASFFLPHYGIVEPYQLR